MSMDPDLAVPSGELSHRKLESDVFTTLGLLVKFGGTNQNASHVRVVDWRSRASQTVE
jgi:hypothetical protein